jgi:hypothetical protein
VPDGLGRDAGDISQLDRLARQQAQRPVVVAFGRVGAGDSDHVGQLFAAQRLAPPFLAFVMQHRLHPTAPKRWQTWATVLGLTSKASAISADRPAVGYLQEHLDALERARVGLAAMHGDPQLAPFVVGERHGWGCEHADLLQCASAYRFFFQIQTGLSTKGCT